MGESDWLMTSLIGPIRWRHSIHVMTHHRGNCEIWRNKGKRIMTSSVSYYTNDVIAKKPSIKSNEEFIFFNFRTKSYFRKIENFRRIDLHRKRNGREIWIRVLEFGFKYYPITWWENNKKSKADFWLVSQSASGILFKRNIAIELIRHPN